MSGTPLVPTPGQTVGPFFGYRAAVSPAATRSRHRTIRRPSGCTAW